MRFFNHPKMARLYWQIHDHQVDLEKYIKNYKFKSINLEMKIISKLRKKLRKLANKYNIC